MSPQKKQAAKAASKPAKKTAKTVVAQTAVPVVAPAPSQIAAPVVKQAEESGGKTLTGKVISNKMQKTVAVQVERLVRHPTYGKYQRRTTKLMAHDEASECREGDMVTIAECRPISRHKSWRVVRVVERAAAQ